MCCVFGPFWVRAKIANENCQSARSHGQEHDQIRDANRPFSSYPLCENKTEFKNEFDLHEGTCLIWMKMNLLLEHTFI